MKIDLVYLWCDGNDPSWRSRRAKYLVDVDTSDEQTFCEGRFVDNDDLLYSLRSVEMYAPWINHIYIVTDNQRPSWLNLNNPKLSVVDHTELFPPEVLPLYNSCAIELGIHKIKGLSEHYLYANDDTMLGRAIDPDFFFTNEGKAICRFHLHGKKLDANSNTYLSTISKVQSAIVKDFGEQYGYLYANHCMDTYIKSNVEECVNRYKSWNESTIKSRFRTPNDMQRHIMNLYSIATGKGEILITNKMSKLRKLFEILAIFFGSKVGFDSRYFYIDSRNILRDFKLFKPALVCFNDAQNVTNSHREALKRVYTKLYPHKSQFEK